MIDRAFAEHYAADWIKAWNAHDLDAILSHYADDIVFRSPRIAVVMGENVDFVAGKPALARYWRKALSIAKDLHFTFDGLYVGSDSLTIAYRNPRLGIASPVADPTRFGPLCSSSQHAARSAEGI